MKKDEEGNFVDTDDCQELEKTVCKEVATPEEARILLMIKML